MPPAHLRNGRAAGRCEVRAVFVIRADCPFVRNTNAFKLLRSLYLKKNWGASPVQRSPGEDIYRGGGAVLGGGEFRFERFRFGSRIPFYRRNLLILGGDGPETGWSPSGARVSD